MKTRNIRLSVYNDLQYQTKKKSQELLFEILLLPTDENPVKGTNIAGFHENCR
jgi:hypothetical protein